MSIAKTRNDELLDGKIELRAELWMEEGEWKILLHAPRWLLVALDQQMEDVRALGAEDHRPELKVAGGPGLLVGAGNSQASTMLFVTGLHAAIRSKSEEG